MGQKNAKGSVAIIKESGRIRLRWRYQKQRYSLNLFHHTKPNLLQAKKVALIIENDMVSEAFDFTLNKYKPGTQVSKPKHRNIVELFTQWVTEYRNRDADKGSCLEPKIIFCNCAICCFSCKFSNCNVLQSSFKSILAAL